MHLLFSTTTLGSTVPLSSFTQPVRSPLYFTPDFCCSGAHRLLHSHDHPASYAFTQNLPNNAPSGDVIAFQLANSAHGYTNANGGFHGSRPVR
jgi:hypothetical protein